MRCYFVSTFFTLLFAGALASQAAEPATSQSAAPTAETASHPKEVALVDEAQLGSVYRETTMSLRLYTHDADPPGVSTCNGGCASAWPPLHAPADARPVGEWSVVRREDGSRQWAFRAKPVYFRFHDTPSEPTGIGIDGWRVIPYFSRVESEISRAEALAASHAMWHVLDANEDGVLDARDRDAQRDRQFARIDTDHNGELSAAELRAGSPEFRGDALATRMAWFARLDENADGGLSRAELAKGGAGQLPAESSRQVAFLFSMADTNHDKKVSRVEFDAIVEKLIDRFDSNHDGKISRAEHEAGRTLITRMSQGMARKR